MRTRRLAPLLVVAVLAAGCGGGDEGSSAGAGGATTAAAEGAGADDTTGATAATPTSTTSPTTTTTDPDCPERVATWPLRRRLARLVIVGVDPSGPGEATALVEQHHVGGLFVGGNDTTLLTSGALAGLGRTAPGPMVAIDEEGGRVQRIEGLDGDVPSARSMAASMTPDQVRALAERRGRVMAAHGVTVDLAPVVDVSDQPDASVIGDRSWSADPEVVATYARAYADGLLAAGVTPVLKHFPGHGQASGDTHAGAATTPPLAELEPRDLVPYQRLLPDLGDEVAVMLGHLDVPGLTEPDTPASLSPTAVALLRDTYRFDGVVMTDDLADMASITARLGPEEAAVRALAAGVDQVLLAGADVAALLDRLEAAVADGTLVTDRIDASVARVLRLQGLDPCTVRF